MKHVIVPLSTYAQEGKRLSNESDFNHKEFCLAMKAARQKQEPAKYMLWVIREDIVVAI